MNETKHDVNSITVGAVELLLTAAGGGSAVHLAALANPVATLPWPVVVSGVSLPVALAHGLLVGPGVGFFVSTEDSRRVCAGSVSGRR